MQKKKIKIEKLKKPDDYSYCVNVSNPKARDKYVKQIERLIRSSIEYRNYILFLRDHMDMSKCAFFNNLDKNENKRIKIEVHHDPFTLYDYVNTVVEKHIQECIPLNDCFIADEVMELHYKNMVGLIPLSVSLHQMAHRSNKLIIPLFLISGHYEEFIKEYGKYIDDLDEKLKHRLDETKAITSDDYDFLSVEFKYIEVDGFSLPEKVDVDTSNETTSKDSSNIGAIISAA